MSTEIQLREIIGEVTKATNHEKVVGLTTPVLLKYTDEELNAILFEFERFKQAKNEDIPDAVLSEWINTFMELNMTPPDVVKRIRLAKLIKKYAVTEFHDFIDVPVYAYNEVFSHQQNPDFPGCVICDCCFNGSAIYVRRDKLLFPARESQCPSCNGILTLELQRYIGKGANRDGLKDYQYCEVKITFVQPFYKIKPIPALPE